MCTSVWESNGQISEELNSKLGALQGPQGRPGAEGKQGTKGEKVRPRCSCLFLIMLLAFSLVFNINATFEVN